MSKYQQSEKINKTKIDERGTGFTAVKDIKEGEALVRFDGEAKTKPDRMTLQIGKDKHLGGPGEVNHSCDPNCHIELDPPRLISSQKIQKGEEITFNYLTTEWEFAETFRCKCDSSNCFGKIKGFKHLSPEERQELNHVKEFLWNLVEENE